MPLRVSAFLEIWINLGRGSSTEFGLGEAKISPGEAFTYKKRELMRTGGVFGFRDPGHRES